MAADERRSRPLGLTIAVLVLAVIGLISILGWVLSAVGALIKLAVIVVIVLVAFAVIKRVVIGKPDDNLPVPRDR